MRYDYRTFAIILLHALTLAPPILYGQGTRADYERSDQLRGRVQGKVFKARVQPFWFAEGNRFWYRNDLADGQREFLVVDAVAGKREVAFDHVRLAGALQARLGSEISPQKLPVEVLEFTDENKSIRFFAMNKYWKFSSTDASLTEIERFDPLARPNARPSPGSRLRPAGSPRSARSPNGKLTVLLRDHNLVLRDEVQGEDFPLTSDGTGDHFYEERAWWAPDSSCFVAMKTSPAESHTIHLIESSPRDQLQPKLHSLDYLKPGDRIAQSKPHLFLVASHQQIPIRDELFSNPWSISQIHWSRDSRRFTFLYNQRGHQMLRIIAVAGDTGEAGVLLEEKNNTFIDYAHKQFTHYVEPADEFIWMSERDGWNHLYLHDARTGQVKNQITRGPWVVRGVERVDDQRRQIWFRAGGLYPEQDPYYVHFGRVNFDGSGLVLLTDGNGTHTIDYSPDRRFLVDTWSRVDQPPITELRKVEDGSLVMQLEQADWTQLLATGWQIPERFVAKGRDGVTDIYGVIYRPTNFHPEAKYPVIEQIYAGPQGAFVPKSFASYHSPQGMAELGFVLVQIDGMGTNWRSKKFHDVCCKNLADSGFPDRIAWLQQAAEKYPYLDLTRVGIYGGSAGGQSATRAVLAHGDVYKVAVSDCGCHDNRMDKIWWNELWMGWPIGPHYAEQSNVTQAARLEGKLMLIVGELDRNVDPASTMQVVNALIRANKDFDLLLVPGAGHGSAESPYGQRRRKDFFVRHLLGIEPRSE